MRLNIILSILLHGVIIIAAFYISFGDTVYSVPAFIINVSLTEEVSGNQFPTAIEKRQNGNSESKGSMEDIEMRRDSIRFPVAKPSEDISGEKVLINLNGYGDVRSRSGDKPMEIQERFFYKDELNYYGLIREMVEKARIYPALARKKGIEGKVVLRFRIKPDGEVAEVVLVKGSGFEILDRISIETIKRAAPLPYVSGWIELPMIFRLD